MKKCSKCGESKPLDQFHKQAKSKGTFKSACKSCACDITRKWYADNRARAGARSRKYRAKNPDRVRESSRKYRVANADRVRESNRKYHAKNPDAVKLAEHIRRARKQINGVYVVTVKNVRYLLAQPCYLCETAPSIDLDHIIPLAKGGRHAIGNLLGACKSCNNSKGSMFLFEFKVRRRVLTSNQTCERGNCEPC